MMPLVPGRDPAPARTEVPAPSARGRLRSLRSSATKDRISRSMPRDLLHAMQCRPAPPPQVRDGRPAQRLPSSDRGWPLRTAGDRGLWHVGGTAGENDVGSHLAAISPVRPLGEADQGNDCLVGKGLRPAAAIGRKIWSLGRPV